MNLSHPNRTLGLRTTASCGDKQALMQRPEIESTVEAVGECGQVPSGILSEGECMVATTQAGLEVTEDGVDPLELGQVFRLSSRDDGGLMHTAGLDDPAETGQPIGTYGAPHGQVRPGPRRNRLEGETGHRGESLTRKGWPSSLSETAATKGTLFSEPRPALPPLRSPPR